MFIIDQFKVKYKFSRLPRRQYTIFEERAPKKTQLLGQHFSNIANRWLEKSERAQRHREKDRLKKIEQFSTFEIIEEKSIRGGDAELLTTTQNKKTTNSKQKNRKFQKTCPDNE